MSIVDQLEGGPEGARKLSNDPVVRTIIWLWLEGFKIVKCQLWMYLSSLSEALAKLFSLSNVFPERLNSQTSSIHHSSEQTKGKPLGEKLPIREEGNVTIAYGLGLLSKLLAFSGFIAPAFLLHVRLNRRTSKTFVIFNYIGVCFGVSFGIFLYREIILDNLGTLLPGLDDRILKVLTRSLIISEALFLSISSVSFYWIIHKRKFFNKFALFKSSSITLDRNFQLNTIFRIFFTFYIASILSEPIFVALTVNDLLNQPRFYPNMEPETFRWVKQVHVFIIGFCAFLATFIQQVIPIMITFLIAVIEEFTNSELNKYLTHLERANNSKINHRLLNLLDKKSKKMINDFALDTICMDWPEVESEEEHEVDKDREEQPEVFSSGKAVVVSVNNCNSDQMDWSEQSELRNMVIGSRLFLFKNLAKRLSEIKEIIKCFEEVFGSFHWVVICSSSLLLCQSVVVGIIQVRLIQAENNKGNGAQISVLGNPLVTRTALSVLIYATSNTILFLRSDRLPYRMSILRSQLFKINLDLFSLSLNSSNKDKRRESWPELELIWSLYDQVYRLSTEINFRFFSKTFYSKQCLLMIFSRVGSVILLYFQVVEIFSNI